MQRQYNHLSLAVARLGGNMRKDKDKEKEKDTLNDQQCWDSRQGNNGFLFIFLFFFFFFLLSRI